MSHHVCPRTVLGAVPCKGAGIVPWVSNHGLLNLGLTLDVLISFLEKRTVGTRIPRSLMHLQQVIPDLGV